MKVSAALPPLLTIWLPPEIWPEASLPWTVTPDAKPPDEMTWLPKMFPPDTDAPDEICCSPPLRMTVLTAEPPRLTY